MSDDDFTSVLTTIVAEIEGPRGRRSLCASSFGKIALRRRQSRTSETARIREDPL